MLTGGPGRVWRHGIGGKPHPGGSPSRGGSPLRMEYAAGAAGLARSLTGEPPSRTGRLLHGPGRLVLMIFFPNEFSAFWAGCRGRRIDIFKFCRSIAYNIALYETNSLYHGLNCYVSYNACYMP